MAAPTTCPIDVQVITPPHLLAGEWSPVIFQIECSSSTKLPVTLRSIFCTERSVQLDTDLFQRDLILQPGECYRVLVPIRVLEPRTVPQQTVAVQYQEGEQRANAVNLPEGTWLVCPSLGREIKISLEPLCTYEEGTKLLLRFDHQGATLFKELRIHIEPTAVLSAAKTVHRSIFRPGNSVQMEAVVRPGSVEVVISAAAMGRRIEVRIPWTVPVVQAKADRATFRFLEPRRLSMDQISIYHGKRKRDEPVFGHEGAFPVHGHENYQIIIRPQISGVKKITLREAPEKVAILNTVQPRDSYEWTFLVEVIANNLFSRAEHLYYDVESDSGTLTGEIHLVVKPPRSRYLLFAATAGAALTIQGGVGLFHVLKDSNYSIESVLASATLSWNFQLNLLALLSIPLIWLVMPVTDLIRYRFLTDD